MKLLHDMPYELQPRVVSPEVFRQLQVVSEMRNTHYRGVISPPQQAREQLMGRIPMSPAPRGIPRSAETDDVCARLDESTDGGEEEDRWESREL